MKMSAFTILNGAKNKLLRSLGKLQRTLSNGFAVSAFPHLIPIHGHNLYRRSCVHNKMYTYESIHTASFPLRTQRPHCTFNIEKQNGTVCVCVCVSA